MSSQYDRNLIVSTEVLKVDFNGVLLPIFNYNNEPYVPMRGFVEDIGLGWNWQRQRINHQPKKFKRIISSVLNGREGQVCLHLKSLPLWLSSVDPSKVRLVSSRLKSFQDSVLHVNYVEWESLFNDFYFNTGEAKVNTIDDLNLLNFYNFDIYTTVINNQNYVLMKPIVNILGLDWLVQKENIVDKFYSSLKFHNVRTSRGIEQALCLSEQDAGIWLDSVMVNSATIMLFKSEFVGFLNNLKDHTCSSGESTEDYEQVTEYVESLSSESECTDLVRIENNEVLVDSLMLAKNFNRRHADVLLTISRLNCSKEFAQRNFVSGYFKDKNNQKRPMYTMTRDGCVFLISKLKGSEAGLFLERYIAAFNEMESMLTQSSNKDVCATAQQPSSNIIPDNTQFLHTSIKELIALNTELVSSNKVLTTAVLSINTQLLNHILSKNTESSEFSFKAEGNHFEDSVDTTDDLDEIDDDVEFLDDEEQEILSAKDRWNDGDTLELKLRSSKIHKNLKYHTVSNFLKLKKLKHIELSERRNFGLKCYELSKHRKVEVKSIPNAKFDKVNLYRQDILEHVYFENFNIKDGQVVLFDPKAKHKAN